MIQVFSEDGRGPPTARPRRSRRQLRHAALGAQGERRATAASATSSARARFETDGYRDHSAAERQLGNAKLSWQPDDAQHADARRQPPRPAEGAGPARPDARAVRGRPARRRPVGRDRSTPARPSTRRSSARSTSAALDAANALRAAGLRRPARHRAVPGDPGRRPRRNPLHPGGVISLDRDYRGTDVRWTHQGARWRACRSSWSPASPTTTCDEQRTRLPELRSARRSACKGALRRDERNDGRQLRPVPAGSTGSSRRAGRLNAGVRHSRVQLRLRRTTTSSAPIPTTAAASTTARRCRCVGVLFAASDSAAPVRHRRPRLRDADAQRARLPAERPDRAQPGAAGGAQQAASRSAPSAASRRAAMRPRRCSRRAPSDEIVTPDQRRRPLDLPERRRDAAPRRRAVGGARSSAATCALQGAYTWLDARYRDPFQTCAGDALPDADPDRFPPTTTSPASPATRSTPRSPGRRRSAGAAASRSRGAEQGLGQRRQHRRRRGLRDRRRQPRLPGADRRRRAERLRPHRQPVRPALRRLGDRRRRQRALLRAGARPHLDRRRLGRAPLLSREGRRR